MQMLKAGLLDEIKNRLIAEFKPEEIWLFGSHAWGQPDEGSDVDLLVIVPESREGSVQRAQRAHRCLRGLGIAKDVLVKTRQEVDRFKTVSSSLEAEIFGRGRRLYG